MSNILSAMSIEDEDMDRDTKTRPPSVDPFIFFNIAAPSSVFICGSQGSGKSHTLSCLLENCLFKSAVSELDNPLAGLVLHYDSFGSEIRGTPCEAAYLSSNPDIKVRILCAPTSVDTIKQTYMGMNVEIVPLQLNQADLNTQRILDLMAVRRDGSMPLYMHAVRGLLTKMKREQQKTNTPFNYAAFRSEVGKMKLTETQRLPMDQRLIALESFIPTSQTDSNDGLGSRIKGSEWSVKPGTLTIVDLSCPCVTPESACALFDICLCLFLEQKTTIGRFVALDEAHKYMNSAIEATALTNRLHTCIREQRHNGTRVFISTQEPPISPVLLDLCSINIVHHFVSSDWLRTLKSHLAALNSSCGSAEASELEMANVFKKIVALRVGEAIIFAPSAVTGMKQNLARGSSRSSVERLGIEYLKVRIRDRLTSDGGKSVLALPVPALAHDLLSSSLTNSVSSASTPTPGVFGALKPVGEKVNSEAASIWGNSTGSLFAGINMPSPVSFGGNATTSGLFESKQPAPKSTFFGNQQATSTGGLFVPVAKPLFGNSGTSPAAPFSRLFGPGASVGTKPAMTPSGFGIFGITKTQEQSPTSFTGTSANNELFLKPDDPPATQPVSFSDSFDPFTAVKPPTVIEGTFEGFNQGTQIPFTPLVEREPNSSPNQMNNFEHICFWGCYEKYSPEELRLKDYDGGRKMVDAPVFDQAIAGLDV